MNKLIIAASKITPEINFDGNSGIFKISDKSYPENVNDFYTSIFDYINEYSKNPQKNTILEFNWNYFNSGTAFIISKLIYTFKEINTELTINWLCEEDFDLMIEKGEELQKTIIDVNFNIVHP